MMASCLGLRGAYRTICFNGALHMNRVVDLIDILVAQRSGFLRAQAAPEHCQDKWFEAVPSRRIDQRPAFLVSNAAVRTVL